MTNELKNARQRDYRSKTNNQCTRKYEKTKSGFIMRMYRNMQSRITGIQWKKRHLYSGKELLSRENFYSFAFNDSAFHELFDKWEKSGYDRRLAPSIDRINSDYGYKIDNIRFITFSENCKNVKRWKSQKVIRTCV